LALSVPNEGCLRNVPCAHHLISTFVCITIIWGLLSKYVFTRDQVIE